MSSLHDFAVRVARDLSYKPKCRVPETRHDHVHVPVDTADHFPLLTWLFEEAPEFIIERNGTWCEFGVFQGESLKYLSVRRGQARLFGFDSFEGLPEDWVLGAPKGTFATAAPLVPGADLVVGWFSDTLSTFNPPDPVTFVHVDCDLYSSSVPVLDWLTPRMVPGTVVLFDELLWEPYEKGEMRALMERWGDGRSGPVKYEWVASGRVQAVLVIRGLETANRPPQE